MDQESSSQDLPPLRILVGADVSPDPNAGASGTVWQMNEALRRRGNQVDEIWAEDRHQTFPAEPRQAPDPTAIAAAAEALLSARRAVAICGGGLVRFQNV